MLLSCAIVLSNRKKKNQCINKPIIYLTVAITTSSSYNKVNALVLSSNTIEKMTFAENYIEFIQLTENHDPTVQTHCIFRHHCYIFKYSSTDL